MIDMSMIEKACLVDPPERASVLARIREKKDTYERYGFSEYQVRTLWAFFDLAQEFDTLENFFRVCVFVPKEFLHVDSTLYLIDDDTGRLSTVCDSLQGLNCCGKKPPADISLADHPYETEDSYVAPIKGNRRLIPRKPINMAEDIIGLFEVYPKTRLNNKDRLFFQKYANRIGYNLHYKLISKQNEEHIKFISTLVADIEHNVVVPNMSFKVFFRALEKKIGHLQEIGRSLEEQIRKKQVEECEGLNDVIRLKEQLEGVAQELREEYENIYKHYANTSLFLESLLRRDHFEKGHLVLRKRQCNFQKEIIDPQLERYRPRLERAGIEIDDAYSGVPEKEIPLVVDVGLISQVYANLFSNAVKYCQEVKDSRGRTRKFMSYGREILPDYFGPGKDGIKFNVFTTGPPIPEDEVQHLFDEGFRCQLNARQPGTGHGLHFVKKVVDVHGGVVGYERTAMGNNFFFILPLQKQHPVDKEA